MTIQPLKRVLTRQAILIAVLPFTLLISVAILWLLPGFIKNIESHQVHLSQITALKTENYLIRSMSVLQGISNFIETNSKNDNFHTIIHSQMKTSDSLRTIYVINKTGKVEAVSLKSGNKTQENELTGLDYSESALFKESIEKNIPIWSNSFLSVIGGGLSVALAIPGNENVVMGEIDLGLLTGYLKQISTNKEQLIMVLDRRGQVIADQDGRLTAQQLNLNHLEIVKKGLNQQQPIIEDFKLHGRLMTGCIIKSDLANWSIIVALPKDIANRPVRTAVKFFSVILLGSILIAVFMMMNQAIKLSDKFTKVAHHAGKISTGEHHVDQPNFDILEFKELTDDIQKMANTIRERERYNRILFSDSPIPLLVIDPLTAECIDGNESVLRILEIESHDMLVKKSTFDFSPQDQENGMTSKDAAIKHARETLKSGYSQLEWVLQKASGQKLYCEINLASFQYKDRTLLQMSIKDITGEKTEEARRIKLEKQLRQSQKMESIGTLAGGIAHDFNNILFPMMGFTEMILEDLSQDAQHKMHLQEIYKGCIRARDLVQQILAFSRQTEKELQPIQIDLILKEIIQLSRSTLPSTISIQKYIMPDTGMVLADPTQIHQVFMNLIINAFHAMEEHGGTLNVRLDVVQISSETMPNPDFIPGDYICLTISDTGVGIDPEIMENIFDPYFTTKGKGKGTGLGLSVVHGIVKNYKGKILIESEKSKGTEVKVYLPKVSTVKTINYNDEIPPDLSGSGNILVIDDEEQVSMMIEQMLGRLGYQVTSKNDSSEALALFLESSDHFDLVISDMTMPVLTGDQLIKEIKQIRPDIPAILITGFSEKIDMDHPLQIHVDAILMKPILKNDLASAILRVMKKARNNDLDS